MKTTNLHTLVQEYLNDAIEAYLDMGESEADAIEYAICDTLHYSGLLC